MVFRREKVGPLPPAIRGRRIGKAGVGDARLFIPIILVLLIMLAGAAWFGEVNGMFDVLGLQPFRGGTASSADITATLSPTWPTSTVPTPAALFPPLLTAATSLPTAGNATVQPTYFDPSADTPTPVSTAGGWCGHELDVAFGGDTKLVIHRMGGGDSLNKFEITYRTSVKAIEGINLQFRIPVPRETVLVIPLDTTEVGSLPVFEPMQVSEENIPIQTMAFKANSDLLAFERYNGFDDSCRFFIGWVVAPRERSSP